MLRVFRLSIRVCFVVEASSLITLALVFPPGNSWRAWWWQKRSVTSSGMAGRSRTSLSCMSLPSPHSTSCTTWSVTWPCSTKSAMVSGNARAGSELPLWEGALCRQSPHLIHWSGKNTPLLSFPVLSMVEEYSLSYAFNSHWGNTIGLILVLGFD